MKVIKNILNLSVSELLVSLYESDDSVFVGRADLHNHLKIHTDNFQLESLHRVYNDVMIFAERRIELNWFGEIVVIGDIRLEKPQHVKGEIKKQDADRAYNDFKRYDNTKTFDYLRKFASYVLGDISFSTIFNQDISVVNRWGFIYIDIYYSIVNKFRKRKLRENIEEEEEGEIGETEKQQTGTTAISKRNDLVFIDLLKNEYADPKRIEKFKQWLQTERIIKDDLLLVKPTNFARIYFLLQEEDIIAELNISRGIRVFFKEFGLNVVETKGAIADTRQIARKTVTGENAKNTGLLIDGNSLPFEETARKRLNEIFKSD